MQVTCYPIPGKRKAFLTCEAFAAGVRASGGVAEICTTPPARLKPGAAMFYGVRPAVQHLWEQAKAEGRDWYYADNSYFDAARERFFRVTKNALQHSGIGQSDGKRLASLGVQIKPWRATGEHILVCMQSAEFMQVVAGKQWWLGKIVSDLVRRTQRPIRVRENKHAPRRFAQELADAWAVVTWSSAAAINAVLAGVPAFCSGECAAATVGNCSLDFIEAPRTPDGRERWAAVLADNEWTLDELRTGACWPAIHGGVSQCA